MKIPSRILLVAFCLCASMANAQQGIYKDTIYVPVTFYDFHSNGSNPEFEPPFFAQSPIQNMVLPTLDADGKPQLGPNMNQNQYVKYWFRPWKDSIPNDPKRAQGDYTIPVYTQTGGAAWAAQIRYDGTRTVNYDTAFKNVVIQGTLAFHHIGGGVYQYENTNFFPLDNSGFGNETRAHNYSFTMELKWQFQKKTGQSFDFSGDDDVWAFVNGQLAMDLGGIHPPESGQFSMDQFPAIPPSTVCTLSVFYTERCVTGSDIKITTNMVSSKFVDYFPSIDVQPDSTICLGDTVTVSAKIVQESGILTQIPKGCSLSWSLNDPLNPPSTLTQTGLKCKFLPVRASTAKISYTLYDSVNQVTLSNTARIYVKSCSDSVSNSMDFYDTAGDPKTMTPLKDTITVVAGTQKIIYAKIFDNSMRHSWISQYEQVDSLSKLIKWKLSDTIGAQILSEGSKVTFKCTIAFKNYMLTASYASGAPWPISHSVVIKVAPVKAMMLVIEPNHDGLTESPNKIQIFPDNTVIIKPNEIETRAYAVIRDIYGNFVRFCNQAEWSIDNPIASLTKGDTTFGEVIITRTDSSGQTMLHVTDKMTGGQAWAYLRILKYYYSSGIKIVVKQNIAGKDSLVPIDSLIMPTGQDSVLYVAGKRSDNRSWELVTAKWETSSLLAGRFNLPASSSAMNVFSKDTGTGWISVSTENGAIPISDTVYVKFTSGKSDVKYADGKGNKIRLSRLSYKLNGPTLILCSPEKHVGCDVLISDISGRTIDKFVIENTIMNRIIGSKNTGTKSGLYIVTIKGKSERIVVPLKIGN